MEKRKRKKNAKNSRTLGWTVNCCHSHYSLTDVGYGVHPTANANLIAYIWRVAELMHNSNVIGIGPLEELTLQCNCVNLKIRGRNKERQLAKTIFFSLMQKAKTKNLKTYDKRVCKCI